MLRVCLVQQGAWDMPIDSMPLAVGYLKAMLDADESLVGEIAVEVRNFRGGQSIQEMARTLFMYQIPDVLAFSVLGWNYRRFGVIAETFKQINPAGVVVFGGNHVAYQGERVFREFPQVDVVVNGEGEHTFHELVRAVLDNPAEPNFADVRGVSFRQDSELCCAEDRPRIEDLDTIASPFLSGAIPMSDSAGNFPYDVALMETNRGCPYKCSFCYWGGAIGQRMRSFSAERLAAELDIFGFHQAPSIVLCDSNFGLLEADLEFVEMLIKTRERYGYPKSLITSWAKNKSPRFYDIVRRLKEHGFHSLFTLSLQTLDDAALTDMMRKNMKVNQWEALVDWLTEEGLECYGELIWGAPGETPESFLKGYDRLAEKVSRIAIYPMLLLPNTSYVEHRDLHGFVTIRGEDDDFEYVLANRTSTLAENLEMQRFVFWARVLGEQQYLRHAWQPLRDVVGMTQSAAIRSLGAYFERSSHPAARAFLDRIPLLAESPAISEALRSLHSQPALQGLVRQWWHEVVVPRFPAEWRSFAEALYQYECWSRPVYVVPDEELPPGWHNTERDGEHWYESDLVELPYDILSAIENWSSTLADGPRNEQTAFVFSARPGYYHNLDNHEMAAWHIAIAQRVGGRERQEASVG
jgi:radical SAM C-methyltransferase